MRKSAFFKFLILFQFPALFKLPLLPLRPRNMSTRVILAHFPPPGRYPPTQPSPAGILFDDQSSSRQQHQLTYAPARGSNRECMSARTQRYTPKRHPRGQAAKRASRPAS